MTLIKLEEEKNPPDCIFSCPALLVRLFLISQANSSIIVICSETLNTPAASSTISSLFSLGLLSILFGRDF